MVVSKGSERPLAARVVVDGNRMQCTRYCDVIRTRPQPTSLAARRINLYQHFLASAL